MHHNNNYGRQSLSPAISQNITMQYSTFFPSGAAVTGLFNCRCPTAVSRFIISVIFDTFQCKPRWTWPHIGVKVFKTALPPQAHRNSASTIVFICAALFISAAFQHSLPNSVLAQVTKLVFRVHRGHNFALKAATRLCNAVQHVVHACCQIVPAITLKMGLIMPANTPTCQYQHPMTAASRINFFAPFVGSNNVLNAVVHNHKYTAKPMVLQWGV